MLTRDEINDLKPGPEADAAAAISLGWKHHSLVDEGRMRRAWVDRDGVFMHWGDSWQPSTDDAAAMELVDKVLAEGRECEIRGYIRVHQLIHEFFIHPSTDPNPRYISGKAKTRPLAITRAALLWALEKQEREQVK